MKHDMDTAHGGTNGACNKNAGIMSYQEANKTKKPWSTCSNFDLKVWYNTILAMNMTWCMEGNYNETVWKDSKLRSINMYGHLIHLWICHFILEIGCKNVFLNFGKINSK